MKKLVSASLPLCGILLLLTLSTFAQIPSPKDVLGFTPGDDRKLASWAQIVDYFKKLDAASDRVKFEEIGKTTMGAPFVYATISSPENLKNLEKYKQINAQLADPRTIKKVPLRNGRAMAADLIADMHIREGKTIVLITCGVHSTEVGSTLSSMLIAHRMAMVDHPDVKKILDNTIILLVPSLNPDGVDIVKNWYDKTLGTKFEGTEPPELYHKYVGHDNNRDWYAFTQVETQLTVDKIHNVWHPQIVHDIHQQGAFGSRLFLPPYMEPVEPNVPKQIVEGYTELGNYMADSMRSVGYQGITTNSTYDAWTPARAYSHYHGGVRILSETASARLATPITVTYDQLRSGEGYDVRKESANFGPVWRGGEWNLRKITDHMTTAANALLFHAATNREKWLTRFYEIGKEAVRPRKNGEEFGFLFDQFSLGGEQFRGILEFAGVKVTETNDGALVRFDQPYGAFAKTLAENQKYPDLKNERGEPIPPYDVTAHTLPLLMGGINPKLVRAPYRIKKPTWGSSGADFGPCSKINNHIGLYKSFVPSMDEGWTRFILEDSFERFCLQSFSIGNREIKDYSQLSKTFNRPRLVTQYNRPVPVLENYGTILFPDQSPAQILNGYAKGSMPDEYTGGVGKEGVENLKKFVEAGGTLVFMNRSSNFAIEQFNLPIKDVTRGLSRKDFYIPGSILRTELRSDHPITKGMPRESIAWFESGPAFEPNTGGAGSGTAPPTPWQLIKNSDIRVIASYPTDPSKILLSGWALGAEKIAGKAALVEVRVGKGKIILFGFRPQYRGQSLATFPLLFNAISN
ncbi:MAG: M14 family metallopeptidase [Pyrinomonadaceae bacterium]